MGWRQCVQSRIPPCSLHSCQPLNIPGHCHECGSLENENKDNFEISGNCTKERPTKSQENPGFSIEQTIIVLQVDAMLYVYMHTCTYIHAYIDTTWQSPSTPMHVIIYLQY